MLYVPPGQFIMGSESEYEDDEKPVRLVYLDAFWIDQTEVTNGMYIKCLKAGTCQTPSYIYRATPSENFYKRKYSNYPVNYVDWYAATVYCAWAGARLPGEAEWEKAARGTDGRIYPWGNADADPTRARYSQIWGDPVEVGSYPAGASPYGALDMAGNLLEWVNDWYDIYPGGTSPASTHYGMVYKVIRGGSWYSNVAFINSSNRSHQLPTDTDSEIGFRCAHSLP